MHQRSRKKGDVMEKLNEKALACSFGMIAAIVYVVCAILWLSTPAFMMLSMRSMMHGFASSTVMLSPDFLLIGLIEIVIIAASIGYGIAYFYNEMLPKKKRRR